MDKVWNNVYNACIEYGSEIVNLSPDVQKRLEAIVDAQTNAIAAQHEAEVAAAEEKWSTEMALQLGQLRVAIGLVKQADRQLEQLQIENEGLQAQVTVMAGLLRRYRESHDFIKCDYVKGTAEKGQPCHCAECFLTDKALSAAPKVVYSGPGWVRHRHPSHGGWEWETRIEIGPMGEGSHVRLAKERIHKHGQQVEIFITYGPEQKAPCNHS